MGDVNDSSLPPQQHNVVQQDDKTENRVETKIVAEESQTKKTDDSTMSKVFRTGALVLVWISMGLYMEVNGPTLKDIILRTGSSYEDITGAVSGRSVGKFVGVVIGGILVDKFGRYHELVLAISLTVAAITVTSVPWVTDIDALWGIYFILGVSVGNIDIAGQKIVFALWMEKAASPMHIIHLGYGVGGFIAPLIANPFLADTITTGPNTSLTTSNASELLASSTTMPTTTVTEVISPSRIQYTYVTIGVVTMAVACILYFYQFRTSRHHKRHTNQLKIGGKDLTTSRRWLDMINPASCADGNFCFGSLILFCLFLKYFVYTAGDRGFSTFIRSYSIDHLEFSKDDASYLNTIYWIFYAVGRFVAFILTRWVSVTYIMPIESVCMVGVAIGLSTFGTYSQTALWILTGMTGFFLGPMFPSGMAWGGLHIEMTGTAQTWILLGSSFGGLAFLKTGGYVYDNLGAESFVYMFLIVVATLLVIDVILLLLSVSRTQSKKQSYKVESKEKSTSPAKHA